MPKIRVLIVEDSLTVRRHIRDALNADDDIDIVGEADDGRHAIALCQELRPDVMTVDMVLPSMSGLGVTEHVMGHTPTPILIVSSSSNRGDLFNTYDALAAGALDVLEKPSGNEADGEWEQRLRSAVKLVSRIKVITHIRARLSGTTRAPGPPTSHFATGIGCRAMAIGASTGGPSALVEVLRGIPAGFEQPVFMVLHIDQLFATSFAEWLSEHTGHRVVQAREGEQVSALGGHVIMGPPGKHLVVTGGRLRLTLEPERHSCRPSIDTLFESVAREYGASTAGCLLTGMGRDGAQGLLSIRHAGGSTIAQDEATSVVYGMPREAALIGAPERILPLWEIGSALAALMKGNGHG